jgi:hypothetical protein
MSMTFKLYLLNPKEVNVNNQKIELSGKMKDRMKLSLSPKLMVFGVSSPPLNANAFFCRFKKKISPCV